MDPSQAGASILFLVVIGVAAILVVIVIVAAAAISSRRRTPKPAVQQRSFPVHEASLSQTQPITPLAPPYGIQPAHSQEATLTILTSDDPAMIGKTILLSSTCTTIGSGPGNDIPLSGDKLISRQHALMEIANNALFLSEIAIQDEYEQVKRPTYGTFVNEQKIGTIPVQLNTGDVIRLGARFKIRFEGLAWQSEKAP